jgi:amino acid efflux transporter
MGELKKTLGLLDGTTLAIGSIIGSGILFLPSLTFSIAKYDVAIVWPVATLLCIPLLFIFSDMLRVTPNAEGIESFIQLGLGKNIASAIPIIFLGTVTLGMPSAAIIAGQYAAKAIDTPFAAPIVAYSLIGIAILVNFLGGKLGGKINTLVAFSLFLVGGIVVFMTARMAVPLYPSITPKYEFSSISRAIVLAFWAYAGFENLSFIAGEFKNPKRDYFLSMIFALIICGILYFALSINYAALIGNNSVDSVAGMSQLTMLAGLNPSFPILLAVFAIFCVLINLISWTWGISRLIFSSANKGFLPGYFGKQKNDIPQRATLLLGSIFCLTLSLAILLPEYFESALKVVSTNFVYIYVLCLLSYVVYVKTHVKRFVGLALLVGLLILLSSSGWLLLYPVSLTAISWMLQRRIQ